MRGQFWYFGGSGGEQRVRILYSAFNYLNIQAMMIMGCQIVRLPDMPFYFRYGSCNTFKPSEEKALMCFGVNSSQKECYMLVLLTLFYLLKITILQN